MAEEKYFWNDNNHNFAKKYEFGENITKLIKDDPRLKGFLKSGKVSTEKPNAKEPKMGEVDSLRAQIATLQESAKVSEFDENQVKTLQAKIEELKKNQGGGSEISQEDLDTAKGESVQKDLNKIAELEKLVSGDTQEIKDQLDFVIEAFSNLQAGDKKEEIWAKVKEVKDLLASNGGE